MSLLGAKIFEISTLFAQPRLLYSLADDGLLPEYGMHKALMY